MRFRLGLLALGALAGAALAHPAGAVPLMDQIGADGSFQQGLSNNSTQISNLYASAPQFNVAVVDDFTLAESAAVTGVDAALFASNASVALSQITSLRVNFFSSRPTAANFSIGDILSTDVPIAQVALTSPWTTSAVTALASLNLSSLNLVLNPGTYWVSVIALNNSFSTDMGVLLSSFAGTPGNDNARQVGSGLWGGGGDRALNADAAYRVSGTVIPEPSTGILLGVGVALLARRRARLRE